MIGINKTILFGNLANDPESIADGKGTSFRIAFNTYGGKEKDDHSNFVTVKVWGGQAGPVRDHCSKGKPVMVEGKLVQERWENKDNQKQSQVVIVADQVQFLRGADND